MRGKESSQASYKNSGSEDLYVLATATYLLRMLGCMSLPKARKCLTSGLARARFTPSTGAINQSTVGSGGCVDKGNANSKVRGINHRWTFTVPAAESIKDWSTRMTVVRRRGVTTRSSLAILAALTVGCGPAPIKRVTPTSPVSGLKVEVREFDATRAEVRNYSESVQPYGLQTAQAIVEALHHAGVDAELTAHDGPPRGQVIVEGSVTRVEGGNTSARLLLGGFGPVGATCFGVQGRVRRTDGTMLGEFAVERLAWMDLWWPSADRLLARTARVVGYDVASMITTGRYSRGSLAPIAPHRSTEDRLQELQRLFDSGLLTREEYEQKRQLF